MLTLIEGFFIIMGIISTSLLIIGFLLKAKGVTFVEFFPKPKTIAPQNIVYNNVISQIPQNSCGIDSKKVAAIVAAIKHHNNKG